MSLRQYGCCTGVAFLVDASAAHPLALKGAAPRITEMMAEFAVPPPKPDPPEIPDKLYFRIGDVSKLTNIKTFVLRFWESEFPQLAPKKSGTGHRLYRRKDVETVLEIKRLLYEERFTIEGARNFLQSKLQTARSAPKGKGKKAAAAEAVGSSQGALFDAPLAASSLEPIRKELRALLELLS